ncbi:hypothetical protein Lalb_Chr25g0283531 [Lupinus albus]|uniref:Uncharacterized protein n=1 Tax=Lupinus albus TaxID=3870 RepID=A0A6A4N489_LUPAL|nr:hypothetical protein Lalb_Chr25g0283531 [Lupinus albus]
MLAMRLVLHTFSALCFDHSGFGLVYSINMVIMAMMVFFASYSSSHLRHFVPKEMTLVVVVVVTIVFMTMIVGITIVFMSMMVFFESYSSSQMRHLVAIGVVMTFCLTGYIMARSVALGRGHG